MMPWKQSTQSGLLCSKPIVLLWILFRHMWKKWFQTVDTSTEKSQHLKERLGSANESSGSCHPPPNTRATRTLRLELSSSRALDLERKIEDKPLLIHASVNNCSSETLATTTELTLRYNHRGPSSRPIFEIVPENRRIASHRIIVGPHLPPETYPISRFSSDNQSHLITPFCIYLNKKAVSSMSTYNRFATRCLHTTRPARARIHDKQNHYDVLQVGRTSSKRDIKNRFYEVSRGRLLPAS